MTKEDKELLLKDLCARLPYGVIVRCVGIPKNPYYDHTETDRDFELLSVCPKKGMVIIDHYGNYNIPFTECTPYLRPMSSMTEEEKKEVEELDGSIVCYNEFEGGSTLFDEVGLDWLNAHHFDYRGLIEKGLALEAHRGMYN